MTSTTPVGTATGEPETVTFPLSFAQERIWLADQLNPGSAMFTVSTVLHVDGSLDPGGLRRAVAALVERHEALRTRFRNTADGPVQEVLDRVDVPFDVRDLREAPDAEDELAGLLAAHRTASFDLSRAPLLRVRLVLRTGGRAVLLIGMHHIACDGTSGDILLRDLVELYRAAVRGTEPDLPDLPVQYPDFAVWQRETVDERVITEQLDFWRDELHGTDGRLDLPTDRPRTLGGDPGGAVVHRTLPAEVAAALLDVARAERVSTFMLLLAAYEVVLARTGTHADFCVGTTVAGRTRAEVADVLGCFLNMMALRTDTTGGGTLRELLGRVRRRCLRAYANVDAPFERVVEHLAPDRDRRRTPLFEALIAVQDGRVEHVEVDGATLVPELVAADTAQYDLALDAQIDRGGAGLALCYATGLFDAATAAAVLDRVVVVLTAFTADLDVSMSALTLPELPELLVTLTPAPAPTVPAPAVPAPRTGAPSGASGQLERALLECFSRSLERADLGIHDDFFEAGGTSLAAARLSGALADAVGAPVPLKLLFQHPTVAALARALAGAGAGSRTAVQQAELDQVLPGDITPAGPPRPGPARRALLTGATGFIGAHLLAELLAAGLEQVYCLVRGADAAECADRLRGDLARYALPVDLDRVTVVPGRLDAPLFGLSEAAFHALGDAVDVIYHSGAEMNFVRPYAQLRAVNVLGAREVLRLACTGRPSAVHHISTYDARLGAHLAEAPNPVTAGTADGYVLSKKAAEHLVLEAGRRGLPIGVYRPWSVSADSRSGAANLQDQLTLCLAGTLLIRMAPADIPFPLRLLPVDAVARAVVELSRSTDPDHPIHHLYNQDAVPVSLVHDRLREFGYPITVVPFDQWRVQIARRTAGKLDGFAALLAVDTSDTVAPERVDTANTERRLGWDLNRPGLDARYLRRAIDYLVAAGAVPAPTGTAGAAVLAGDPR
jgi:thioester reductase-like protein